MSKSGKIVIIPKNIRNLLFYHKFFVILWQILVMANLGTYRR